MKLGVGVLFVAIGLLVLWAAVTGRLTRLPEAWAALSGDAPASPTAAPMSGPGGSGAAATTAGRVAAALNVPAGFPNFPLLPQSMN